MILVDDKVWTFLYNKEIIFYQSSELEFAPCTLKGQRSNQCARDWGATEGFPTDNWCWAGPGLWNLSFSSGKWEWWFFPPWVTVGVKQNTQNTQAQNRSSVHSDCLSIKRRFPVAVASCALLCTRGSACELPGTRHDSPPAGSLWGSSLACDNGASLRQWRQTGWHRQLGSAGSSWEDQWEGGSFQNAGPTLFWFPVQGTVAVGSGWWKELRTWGPGSPG